MKARVLLPSNVIADFNHPDGSINPANGKYVFVPQVDEAQPVFDASTQKCVPAVVVDLTNGQPSQVRRTWTVVALSSDELELLDLTANKAAIVNLVAALKAGNASAANVQRGLAWCITAVARMLRG